MHKFYAYRRSDIFGALLFGSCFYLLAKLSVSLPGKSGDISYIWLANGLAVGLLMRLKPNHWLPYVLAAFIADVSNNLQLDYPWWLTISYGIIDAGQAPISVALLQLFLPRPLRLDAVRNLLIWCAVSVVAVNGAFSLLGAAIAYLTAGDNYWVAWRNWFIGGAMGLLAMAPFVVSWTHEKFRATLNQAKEHKLEVAAFVTCLFIVTWIIFGGKHSVSVLTFNDFSFLVVPIFMWAALRHGFRINTFAIVIWFCVSVGFTVSGYGPFAASRFSAETATLHLQIYLITISIMALAAAAAIRERERAQRLHLQALLLNDKIRLRYEAAIRASKSIVYEINLETGQSFWEGSFLPFAEEGVSLHTAMASVHPDDLARLTACIEALKAGTTQEISITYRLYALNGDMHHMTNEGYMVNLPDPLTGAMVPRVVGFIKDVSAATNAKAENAKLNAQLVQAQKMETMGRLSGGIAHDFNNILTGVLGYSEIALDKVDVASPVAKNLLKIIAAGNRGRALVEQLLAYSRPQDDQDDAIAITPVLEEVRDLIEGSYRHSITLKYADHGTQANVWGNSTQLHQLFMNIATNGIQAMAKGGTLSITISDAHVGLRRIVTLGTLDCGHYVCVSIEDDGPGIPAEVQARMFEPFYTTKKVGSGTGLGLALAASVITRIGGAIDLVSAPDRGSIFHVYLPVAAASETTAQLAALKSLRGNGELIMVVDDEPALQEMGGEILISLGYTVMGFTSSLAALAAFTAAPEKFHAIVSDEVMPELTGSALAAQVHLLSPQTPFIIITAYGGTGFEFRAEQAGVAKILKKPYRKHEIGHALQEILRTTSQK